MNLKKFRVSEYNFFILTATLSLISTKNFAQQQYTVTKISEDANIRSDQRPIPIGFYDAGTQQTFVTWMGAKSTAVVKAYNHLINTWSENKVIGIPDFVDKHNYPGLLKGKDDHLYVFYGCHNSTLKMSV